MAQKRNSSQFGIDPAVLKKINWSLAIKRILVDVRSDFIYAPHVSNVFRHASDDLCDALQNQLSNGRFSPSAPVTIEVPKSSRMQVSPPGSRGPSYSRPGSILLPHDRVMYQIFADQAASLIEKGTDRSRSFSHILAGPRDAEMFKPSRTAWNMMQKALNALSNKNTGYVIKADIANCFGSVNQHTLVNHLESIGYPATLRNALDAMLVLNTGDRNSRGLLQGMFPSDLFGNFYLNPIDDFFKDMDVTSVRYVDDLYVFVDSLVQAEETVRALTIKLRDYDLSLNEAKSKLLKSKSLVIEEPDLEKLFSDATDDFDEDDEFNSDYGFQSEWNDSEDDEENDDDGGENLEVKATKRLFDSISEFPLHVEKIERFCLPLFSAAGSSYAVQHVLAAFARRPAMSQIYCSYLAQFLDERNVRKSLKSLLTSADLHYDWQRMWILAALLTSEKKDEEVVSLALRIYKDGRLHEAIRAVAAIFVAKHGTFVRQKELFDNYGVSSSVYLQTAVLYGARYFHKNMRSAAKKAWSGHSPTHALVSTSIG